MSDVTVEVGTIVRFDGSTPSIADSGTDWAADVTPDVEVLIQLEGVIDTEGRQSDKFDFGLNRDRQYEVLASIEIQATPTTGETIDFYFAPSTSTTQANSNVAGNSGADADCPSGAVPAGITLAEFLLQCDYVGSLVVSNDVAVHSGKVGVFAPSSRFGQLIVVNNSGATLGADDDEHHVVFNGIRDDVA